ncbi:MAG TPA: hypothetical protein PKN48_15980 [Bacteroidales bacterium]|nr:hypothetical protein [Bacteroidales bacterium]
MPEKYTLLRLNDEYQKKVDFIFNPNGNCDETLISLQKELFTHLISDISDKLETDQGVILNTDRNKLMLVNFDKEIQLFKEQFTTSFYKELCENMLKSTDTMSSYFRKATLAGTIANIQDKIDNIISIVGIDQYGNVLSGSYLNKISSNEKIKTKISNYIKSAIDDQQDFMSFRNGLSEIVEETEDIKDVDMDNWDFAHDVFFAQSNQQDNFFADYLGLNYFVYGGTKTTSSRPFCCGGFDKVANKVFESKLSKVFSRKDVEEFDKMDWEGKMPGVKFFAQLGGYGCRHQLMWITKWAAKKRGYPVADGDSGAVK